RRPRRVLRRDVAGRSGRAHPRALSSLGRLRHHWPHDHDGAARGDGADGESRQRPMSARPRVIAALVLAIVAVGPQVDAQQTPKIPKIGFLSSGTPATVGRLVEAFRRGLRELGYVEGKTVVLEVRYIEGKPERLPELARQLVRLKVDMVVASNDAVIAAVKR